MDTTDNDDFNSFWADYTEIREKIQAYQKRVHRALDRHFIAPGIYQPWKGKGYQGSSRVCIFELANGAGVPTASPQIDDAKELLQYWQSTSADRTASPSRRRVIVLEDMNVRMIELLGVLLDVPPEFFLAHCSGRVELGVVDSRRAKCGSSTYWRVDVPQRRDMPDSFNGPYGSYNIEAGAVDRGMYKIFRNRPDVNYFGFVSFWGRGNLPNDLFAALVLVDPHQVQLGYVDPLRQPPLRIPLKDHTPLHSVYHEVPLDSGDGHVPQPFEQPIFDSFVDSYARVPLDRCDGPFSATLLVRNIIRAAWEERVQRDASLIFAEIRRDHDTQRQHFEGLDMQDGSQGSNQQTDRVMRSYQRLMDMRLTTRQNLQLLRMILWKFEFRYAAPATNPEVSAWLHLETRLEELEAHVGSHLKMYAQRAVMQESFDASRQTAASNRLARSSGQLTKIATIVVPCTIVASIFSMNGEFAAGERLFFVYWAISVPVTLALLFWVMQGEIWEALHRVMARDYASTVRGSILQRLDRAQRPDEEKMD